MQATTRSRAAAKRVINKFGGPTEMAKWLKCDRSTISRWKTRGWIPEQNHKKIMLAAKKRRLQIKMADLWVAHHS